MKQISTVLFDLGNVIAYIDFGAFWRDLGFRPEEIAPFTEGYTLFTQQYETGLLSTEKYLNELRAVFNQQFTTERLAQAFSCIIRNPVEGIADIIQKISQTHQTALVSNTNEIHYSYTQRKVPILTALQKHYLSYQLHVMKPAHGFYDAIIRDQKIFPSKMLFIDDLLENVKAAEYAGMQAIKFEGTAQLETSLKTLGVL
jgi:HAD superfamily hydrolase (TIGR01509 family)